MPNKRDPEKKMVGFYVTPEEHRALKQLAASLNTNMTELVKSLIQNAANPIRKRDR
jgi:hypothetical protein